MGAPVGEDPANPGDANNDSLTGLLQRVFLWDQIDDFLGQAKEGSVSCGFWLIDLDGFMRINDELGHNIGDALLRAVAQSLSALVGSKDLLARANGDEFMLFRHHVEDRGEALAIAEQARAVIDQLYVLPGDASASSRVHAHITASVGVALGGTELMARDLCTRADCAMDEAKSLGGNRVESFEDLMEATVLANRPRPTGLPRPIWERTDEIDLRFQWLSALRQRRCAATALAEAAEELPSPLSGLKRIVHCNRVDRHHPPHIAGFRNRGLEDSQMFAWRDARQQD